MTKCITLAPTLEAQADDLATSIEIVMAERDAARLAVKFATTTFTLIRECSDDEKIRAIAAGAVETLKEMPK